MTEINHAIYLTHKHMQNYKLYTLKYCKGIFKLKIRCKSADFAEELQCTINVLMNKLLASNQSKTA